MVDAILAAALTLDLILEATLTAGIPRADSVGHCAGGDSVRRDGRGPPAVARRSARRLLGDLLLQEPLHGQLFSDLPSQSANLVVLLNAYGAGAWLGLRRSVSALAVACALLARRRADRGVPHPRRRRRELVDGLAMVIVLFVGPWVLGRFMRERHRRAERVRSACRTGGGRAGRVRARGDRRRSACSIGARAAGHHRPQRQRDGGPGRRRAAAAATTEPDRARESILNVEQTGREALAEMRRLLGVLRKDDDPRALAPQPGLDQLAGARRSPPRSAGWPVSCAPRASRST